MTYAEKVVKLLTDRKRWIAGGMTESVADSLLVAYLTQFHTDQTGK